MVEWLIRLVLSQEIASPILADDTTSACRIEVNSPVFQAGNQGAVPCKHTMPYKDAEKQREYQRLWKRKRKEEWFLANGPCVDCGSWQNLELDHENPKEKIDHRVWSWELRKRLKELSKCKPRCRRCHRIKTNKDFGFGELIHGTLWCYQRHRCRCEDCTRAKSESDKKYRCKTVDL